MAHKTINFLKIAGISILTLTLIIVGSVIFVFSARGDLPEVDTEDLALRKINFPDQQNAYYDILNISKEKNLFKPDQKQLQAYLAGNGWDDKDVENIIQKNVNLTANFNLAVQKNQYLDPYLADPEKISFETASTLNYPNLKLAVQIEVLKSETLLKSGQPELAFDESFKIVELGHMLEESRPSMIQYLAGVSIKKIGLQSLQSIIDNAPLEKGYLMEKSSALSLLNDDGQGLNDAYRLEFSAAKNTTSKIATEILTDQSSISGGSLFLRHPSFYFKPKETEKLQAEITRNLISHNNLACSAKCGVDPTCSADSLNQKKLTPHSRFQYIFTKNIVGKIIADMTAEPLGGVKEKRCENERLLQKLQSSIKSKQ